MWVGGVGVSAGYLNLPEKTAERWRPDPFLGDDAMMFNTGDLGRWRKDGQLDHLGRADDQVKVKGFRVELDGVAAAMRVRQTVSSYTRPKLISDFRHTSLSEMLSHCSLVRNSGASLHHLLSTLPLYVTPLQKFNHIMLFPVNISRLTISQQRGTARSTNVH